MFLAVSDQILYLIAAAAYGVFAWWNNRRGKGGEVDQGDEFSRNEAPPPRNDAPPPRNDSPPPRNDSPPPAQQPPRSPQQQQGESEQERLRRFLEALGVPAGQQPARPKPVQPAQPPPRPLAPPLPRQVQAPHPYLQPPRVPVPQQRPVVRQVVPVRPPLVCEPDALESVDPGRLEESATAIERIGSDMNQMSQDVRAMSATSQAPAASPGAAGALFTATQARTMVEIFRSPATLRTAVLAHEILGPPRGLQS